MTTPVEIEITVPGTRTATQDVDGMTRSVKALEDNSGSLGASIDKLSANISAMGAKHKNVGEEVERHSSKLREFGKEIRGASGEGAEAIRLFTSSVAAPAAAFIALDEAFKATMEAVGKGLKKGQEDITHYAEDIREAEDAIRSAKEEMNKKDASNFVKSEDVISGLTAAGGAGAIEFAAGLSEKARIPVDKVNKVVLEGFQNGLSKKEITNVVMGAALVESVGKGSFDSASKGASALAASSAGRNTLNGTDADAASGLLNANAIHEYYSPKGEEARSRRLTQEREHWHQYQDDHHMRRTAPPIAVIGFSPSFGTAPGDFLAQTGRQNTQVNSNIARAKQLEMDRALSDQNDFLLNGPKALEQQAKREKILHDYPGIEKMVDVQAKLDSEAAEALAHRNYGSNHAMIGAGLHYLLPSWLGGGGRDEEDKAEEAQHREVQHRIDSAASLGVPVAVFNEMAQSLREISRAVVKSEGVAVPK